MDLLLSDFLDLAVSESFFVSIDMFFGFLLRQQKLLCYLLIMLYCFHFDI
jgi:hypothetical protein